MGAPSLRSRIVIPAAILVTAAYVKGRLDAHLADRAEEPAPIPVATPADPIGRAEAEAADALAVAEAQAAAAAAPVVERTPSFRAHAFRPQPFMRPPDGPPPAAPAVAEEPAAQEAVAAQSAAARSVFEMPAVEWPTFEAEWLAGPRPSVARASDAAERAVLAEWLVTPVPASARGERDAADALCEWTATIAPAAPARAAEAVATEPEPEAAPEPAAQAELVVESGRFSLGGWAAQSGHMALCGVTFRDRRGAPVNASAIRLVPEATTNVGEGGLVVLADAGFAPDAEGFTLLLAAVGPGSFAASGRFEVVEA